METYLGDGLGAFRDRVLGELSWEDEAHRGLDLARRDRRLGETLRRVRAPSSPLRSVYSLRDRRVVLQPSSRTDYVVLGADAGPSKLAAIKKNNLKTLDEDGFLNLIATRVTDPSSLDDKTRKKMQKEGEAIRQAAREMEARDKQSRRSPN